MTANETLKEKLKKNLSRSLGKPYNENYNAGHNYGSITITQKGKQHKLVWELVDRGGKLVDSHHKEYDSFDDMWVDLTRLLR